MAKSQAGKGLSAAKRAAKAPSPVTVTPAAPAAPVAAPAAPAPAVVPLRGGLAIASVKLTGKAYRVGAPHNQAWWQQCQSAVAAGNGQASVAALVQAGVPAIFVGYVVRRGYMASV
jgi:hypothetical protein